MHIYEGRLIFWSSSAWRHIEMMTNWHASTGRAHTAARPRWSPLMGGGGTIQGHLLVPNAPQAWQICITLQFLHNSPWPRRQMTCVIPMNINVTRVGPRQFGSVWCVSLKGRPRGMHRADIAGLGVRIALTERCIRHFEGCYRNWRLFTPPGSSYTISGGSVTVTPPGKQSLVRPPAQS